MLLFVLLKHCTLKHNRHSSNEKVIFQRWNSKANYPCLPSFTHGLKKIIYEIIDLWKKWMWLNTKMTFRPTFFSFWNVLHFYDESETLFLVKEFFVSVFHPQNWRPVCSHVFSTRAPLRWPYCSSRKVCSRRCAENSNLQYWLFNTFSQNIKQRFVKISNFQFSVFQHA